jgi:hypothetical protein
MRARVGGPRFFFVTICSGFFDLCIPLNAFDKTQQVQADEPKQAMKSQHDLYWEERCDTSPTAPGCKIYDD